MIYGVENAVQTLYSDGLMSFTFSTRDTFFLVNCGETCEMSALHFGKVVRFFRLNNYRLSNQLENAENVLVNSCCVITGKVNDVENKLQFVLARPHVKKVVLFGCFAGIETASDQRVMRISSKAIEAINTHFEHRVAIEDISVTSFHPDYFIPYQQSYDPGVRYVLIAQGCENRCSYCNIKNAKGSTKSVPTADIIREITTSVGEGAYEFILLADDCGSYGADRNSSFVELARTLLEIDPRVRLRVHYLFPAALLARRGEYEELLRTGRITYMNVPLQSGSQRILHLMNRAYDPGKVLDTIRRLRELSPKTWFYTHFIINFPTETDEDFSRTLEASAHFDECLFMNYSTNPRTAAAGLDEVDSCRRAHRLAVVHDFLEANGKGLLIDDTTAGPVV
ncbi:MAG: radical SAM protein [Chitinivibrionales bacterium]|nr:radical SAM protein [Chitinivibrionales bacterium]MBD3356853.1 radical SAM protein [Chitinivibrionales bacterium]